MDASGIPMRKLKNQLVHNPKKVKERISYILPNQKEKHRQNR